MNPVRDIFNRTSCCGIREIYGIGNKTPELILYSLGYYLDQGEGISGAHYLFSDNTGAQDGVHYGEVFRDYIINHELGTVLETPFKHNPNSGNMLKAFLWTIDQPAFDRWFVAKVNELATRNIDVYNARLARHGFAVGDFVRFRGDSPNRFEGRARISPPQNTNISLTKQNGEVHSILEGELESLVKTRPYPTPVLPF